MTDIVRMDPSMYGARKPANGLLDDGAPAPRPLLPLLSMPELRARSAAITWLVKGFVPSESIGMVFGASGAFKSFIALDLALHVAHGMKWLGRKTRKGPVIFIAAEGGAGVWRRVDAWRRMHALHDDAVPFYVVPVAVDLSTEASRVREAAAAIGVEPALVIIDTVSQTFAGEENSATEMAAYLRELGLQFREVWQCAVLAVHHTGHQATERPRGSSAIRGNIDFMFGVFRDESEMIATFECAKQKDGEKPAPESFSMHVEDLGRDEDGDMVTSLVAVRIATSEQVLSAMDHEASRGRGGRNHLFLELAVNGIEERKLRQLFCETIDSADAETKRRAYYRARDWAVKNHLVEVAQGVVIRLKT